ncbi:hypothetical protein MESS2_1630006 [Mesorhizobium metallidurans STM 2683]|uniref:Uncharacterized protein n=1 Tax=Mesorhizobium metallidurans STM 2683 TaxID=1297569 RepID=M5ELM8_9HYPH|nr:hypothetical protein MESS2_1630006 [Mesorhizobium metallidurans STM 2683]
MIDTDPLATPRHPFAARRIVPSIVSFVKGLINPRFNNCRAPGRLRTDGGALQFLPVPSRCRKP